MTYYLYIDGGGNSKVPTYFSYILYENDKIAGPIKNGLNLESIYCHKFLTRNIPKNEIPINCSLINKEGQETNNLAEYICCFYAIKRLKEVSGELPCTIRQDSQLVINQVNGLWECRKDHLIPWLNIINFIRWETLKFEWVSRRKIVEMLGH